MIKILLYLNLLFTGCSFNPPALMPQLENEAMDYYQWLVGATSSAYRDELQGLERQDGLNPVVRTVRKALLKSVPADASYEDEREALRLLELAVDLPYATTDEARSYQQFAMIWKGVLKRRLELKQAIMSLDEELEKKQAAIRKLEQDNAEYGKRLEELNGRIDSLNQQIEELKLIEQQIHDREQSLDNATETDPGR